MNILEQEDVPLFYFALNNTFAKTSTNTHIFYVIYDDLAQVLKTYILSQPYTKGFYVGEMAEGCDLIIKEMKEVSYGRIEFLEEERYLHTEHNLKSVALKIQQSQPDFVLACSFRSQRALLKALYEANLSHIPLIQIYAYVSGDVLTEEIRNLYKHFNSISAWHAVSEADLYQQNPGLTARLLLKIKDRSHFSEALIGYELGKIIAALVDFCEANSDCIREKVKGELFELLLAMSLSDQTGPPDYQ